MQAHPPDRQGLARHDLGEQVTLDHAEGVEEPRHDPLVGVDVGGGDVAVGPEHGRDLECVAAGEPLELAYRQLAGITAHPALAAAEGDVDHRCLERHVGRQCRDLAPR